jgi:putative redox protein
MSDLVRISFPGGQRVDATIGNFTVATDQPPKYGGDDSAPAPFDLFLVSIATCAGIFALKFCQARSLSTDGLDLAMEWQGHKDPSLASARLTLTLPKGFPEKYRDGIVKAMDLCAVKRTIQCPPCFSTDLVVESAGGD